MVVSSDIIASIADDLSRLQEKKRAKKLVFYVSQRYWESDYSIIEGYSFQDLLENLYETNPSVEDLKALLYQAVNTLNRKTVYIKIAQYIFKRMSLLYEDSNSFSDGKGNELESEVIDRISENIEYHEEASRLKKLIFAACKQYWENDIGVIEIYETRELIKELYDLYPNPKRLKKALDQVVSSINRQNFYSFIADIIVAELTYLYKHEARDVPAEVDTKLIRAQKDQETAEPENTAEEETSSDESAEDSISIKQATDVVPSSIPEGQVLPWLKVDSLFELKQEIMQYTNPLRSKIVLFYHIYQIDPDEQPWSIVRTCSLDDLLIKLFQQYGDNITTIENQLLPTANAHIEGLEVEENVQSTLSLIECLKRFYKK